MSLSAPSDSSAIEPDFLVGPDLVTFDRRDLPIYATRDTLWADAGQEVFVAGSPLDRLFGEAEPVFVSAAAFAPAPAVAMPSFADDPLVELAGLADGMILPAADLPLDDQACMALTDHQEDAGVALVVTLHDPWSWDPAGTDWLADSLA
jgi:hypothetical protein